MALPALASSSSVNVSVVSQRHFLYFPRSITADMATSREKVDVEMSSASGLLKAEPTYKHVIFPTEEPEQEHEDKLCQLQAAWEESLEELSTTRRCVGVSVLMISWGDMMDDVDIQQEVVNLVCGSTVY
jgi:hypothetical protein